ncbi:unnamed protein product [Arctia plantaginis]|uniref:Uncharacterized protein n=1 Tax=Arctia plantaginis TaxID=874455 RepID=A0A8S1AQX2_ARCPL|nr:unnamed protein product [Arctia plantaginis]
MQQILDVRTHSLALTLARLNAATAMQQILDVRTHSLALTLARLNAATAMQQILDVRTHSLTRTDTRPPQRRHRHAADTRRTYSLAHSH